MKIYSFLVVSLGFVALSAADPDYSTTTIAEKMMPSTEMKVF